MWFRQLVGTKRWIGAVEVGGMLLDVYELNEGIMGSMWYSAVRSFGLRTYIVDFRTRAKTFATPNFYHKALVDFVWTYFYQGPSAALLLPRKFSFRPNKKRIKTDLRMPIFFQQAGHSRTIVGVEQTAEGIKNFIVFDPSQSGENMSIEDRFTR